jgi:tRNA A37 threonylcarbamoyladenosine biosynthesis protein TsaE
MEWPEKIEPILPKETVRIEIKEIEYGKRLVIIYI